MSDTDSLLDAVIQTLGDEEKRVLLVLANRLAVGQSRYGELHLAQEKRDWKHERCEEIQDLLIYSAIATLAEDTRK